MKDVINVECGYTNLMIGEFYSPYNQKRLQESITRLEIGQGTAHELIEDFKYKKG